MKSHIHEERLKNFLKLKSCKNSFLIDLDDYHVKIMRGYRGPVRNDFTLAIHSKFIARLFSLNYSKIREIPNLPKLKWSAIPEKELYSVGQFVTFVADLGAYQNSKESRGILNAPYNLGEKLAPEAMYVTPNRYESFIVELVSILKKPDLLYDAIKREGTITKNVPTWDTFYFRIFSAKLAEIKFKRVVDELEKFKDYLGFDNLNYESIECFYDLIELE